MFESTAFFDWLEKYAIFAHLDRASLAQEKTLLVNNVVCTFVYPTKKNADTAIILIDAGEINISIDGALFLDAVGRNFENYLMNAPLFFFNPENDRLLIGKDFEFKHIEPEIFNTLLEALTMQALAWQQKKV
ncbi:hypothetical protein B9Z45_00975 [Limnohabitans sp. 2KL-17]|nr:hypothetical protein B9Z45_00975 [Limnohabitans sp. 2KL-17]